MNKEDKLKQFLKKVESCKLTAYLDTANIATIAYGTTRYPNGTHVQEGDTCTQQQADAWLDYHLVIHVYPIINRLVNSDEPNGIWIALCSLIYNVGHFGSSIIEALINHDLNALAAAFRLYNKQTINGKLVVCQGLVNRREKEIELFLPKGK